MPRPYSADLRERVLLAHEHGEGGVAALARRFRIGVSTLYRWVDEARAGRRRGRAAGAGGGAERRHAGRVRRAVRRPGRAAAQPLGDLPWPAAPRLAAQEKPLRAAERDRPDVAAARAAWRPGLAGIAPERLVFPDESGIDTGLTRPHARAPRGQRAPGSVPWDHRQRLTLIGALGLGGMLAMMTVPAATDTAVFLAFVARVPAPTLGRRPDAVVVMDNLGAHKTPAVRAALDRAGIAYRYLPPYSPDFGPIGPCRGKLKGRLRACAARTRDALEAELPSAIRSITAEDARGWFRHCKYLPQ